MSTDIGTMPPAFSTENQSIEEAHPPSEDASHETGRGGLVSGVIPQQIPASQLENSPIMGLLRSSHHSTSPIPIQPAPAHRRNHPSLGDLEIQTSTAQSPPRSLWVHTREWCWNTIGAWSWSSIIGTAAAISTIIATILVIVWR
ncbi:hypothetical protein DL93DRAFT_2172270 [Clavulina sp. PMI_390]|nr:hypothetical protein DL93DRAFT_2172270 [Clavulina sp. PMI_390]